jgi:hypothetical protein
MAVFFEELDTNFASHVGGVLLREYDNPEMSDPFEEPEWTPDVEDELPPALLALRNHHLDGRAGIPIRTVAAIGDWEPAQLQQFLDLSTEQQIGWTSEALDRAVAGDDDGVLEADSKALEWEKTVRSLTEALEYVEQSPGEPPRRSSSAKPAAEDQPALFDNPDEPTLFDGFGD